MIKMLMGSIRQYKRESLLSPLFVALEVVLECLLPLVMASMIDNMTGNSMAPIIKYGIALACMAMLSLLCGNRVVRLCKKFAAGFVFQNSRFFLRGY